MANWTGIHEGLDSVTGLAQWGKNPAAPSWGVGRWCSSEPVLLWLWCRLAAAALIRPLAWKLPFAANVAQKRKKKNYMKEQRARITKKQLGRKFPLRLSGDESDWYLQDVGLIPGLTQWFKDPAFQLAVVLSHRGSSDPALLWLWLSWQLQLQLDL